MSKVVNEQTYVNTDEAAALLQTSRQSFYASAKARLRVHRFDGKKTPWYSEKEVIALRDGRQPRKPDIIIRGIRENWTRSLRAQGYEVLTKLCGVDIVTLPADAVKFFDLPADQQFVKRSRMTYADGTPICAWDTYYPTHLIDAKLLDEMKHEVDDVVKAIKDQHGLIVEVAKERYMSRFTTLDEQTLFQLPTDEAVLILQRASYTKGKKELLFFSDMVLLGTWFSHEVEYPVDIWGAA